MGASPTPRTTDAGAPRRVAVAYSGGRDSTALLHACVRMVCELSAEADERIEVIALHVHHGLSAQADQWLGHVQAQCAAWSAKGWPVVLRWRHLALEVPLGASIEAVARDARYAALAEMAQQEGCDTVLLGQHRRDQAETFLLQALRGGGAAGLAAMPREADRRGVRWIRPWLNQSRALIEHYLAMHKLDFVDDDSNRDQRFARNRLRLSVWEALSTAFPAAEMSLARAASHQADLLSCLQDWLADRLALVTRSSAGRVDLNVRAWLAFPAGQQRELLRGWFVRVAGAPMPSSWVARIWTELTAGGGSGRQGIEAVDALEPSCVDEAIHRPKRWPITLEAGVSGELMLYRGALAWCVGGRSAATLPHLGVALSIEREGAVSLPHGLGTLLVERVLSGGIDLSWLAHCELVPRRGGERFQLAPDRPARTLKRQFQSLGVAAWERDGPLLWTRGQLLFVPALGIDARAWAQPGVPQVTVRWLPWEMPGQKGAIAAVKI